MGWPTPYPRLLDMPSSALPSKLLGESPTAIVAQFVRSVRQDVHSTFAVAAFVSAPRRTAINEGG
eukprot:7410439-Alexandrium_andersonii.AAC.1